MVKGQKPRINVPSVVDNEVIISNQQWLSNSLRGKVKWMGAIPSIAPLCESVGLADVQVAWLGGNGVLLSFGDIEKALKVIKVFKIDFFQLFVEIDRWSLAPFKLERTVWLRCYGVHFSLWDPRVFEDISNRFGDIVGVAKETIEKSFCGFGRVCISTNRHLFNNDDVNLEASGGRGLCRLEKSLNLKDLLWVFAIKGYLATIS